LARATEQQTPLVHPLFIWPVTKNPSAPYNNVWSISNHVDHNSGYPNAVQDWNCGNRTYDTSDGYNHKGIDIYTWPFSWYQFQNNQSWAVAAAAGIVVYKNNGGFDMNCSLNNTNWNAVYVQHADGSVAWYGHLKNGSLTTKSVGQSVTAGEYLGVIGSSGNSTGPHLHFEVYNAFNQLVDTYTGACNGWTSSNDSWWVEQKPYQDPKINAVLTHTAIPVFNPCPATETVNLSDNFTVGSPVSGIIYLADQVIGTSGVLTLTRPDGTVAFSTVKSFTSFFYSSYWYWNFPAVIFNQNGIWVLGFSYMGNVVNHSFNYGSLGNDSFLNTAFSVYPNPTLGLLNIVANDGLAITTISIVDMTGKRVFFQKEGIAVIDISSLSSGVYVLQIATEKGMYKSKIVKQ
jgi:murein DD-endopeptidase MepM/ murein hydrolase activator NlpD